MKKHVAKRRKKHVVWLILLLAAICAALLVLADELRIFPADIPIEQTQPQVTPAPPGDPFPDAAAEDRPSPGERWLGLLAQNADTVGSLTFGPVNGQPVVQSDNAFYMTHGFDGKDSTAGALFLDERNALWPRDDNLIVYGHNMRDGSMFGDLDEFRKPAYLKAHPLIAFPTIYDEGDAVYLPLALFDASMNPAEKSYFKVRRPNFPSGEEKLAWIREAMGRSIYKIEADVNEEDAFLTLVTCSYTQDDGRFLIIARKLRAGETAEEATELVARAAAK